MGQVLGRAPLLPVARHYVNGLRTSVEFPPLRSPTRTRARRLVTCRSPKRERAPLMGCVQRYCRGHGPHIR